MSTDVIIEGCRHLNSIKGFRVGFLAGRIEQLASERLETETPGTEQWDAMGVRINQLQRKLQALEKEWGIHVSLRTLPDTWKNVA